MKGISSVITAVLLVSVSVALASMYAGWAPEFSRNVTSTVVEDSEATTKCRNAALSIQDPYYDKNAQTTFFTLKNTGTITLAKKTEIIGINATKLNSTTIYGLEPEDSSRGSFETSRIPNRILVRSEDCPELRAATTNIDIRN